MITIEPSSVSTHAAAEALAPTPVVFRSGVPRGGVRADIAELDDEASLHAMLARVLVLPDYYGHGWDALDECLRDQAALPTHLVLTGASRAWQVLPAALGQLVSVWLSASAAWAAEGRASTLVFVLDARSDQAAP